MSIPVEHSPTRTPQNMDTTPSSTPSVDKQTSRMVLRENKINRVDLRIQEFTPADPELWFSIMVRSFQAAGITTDSTKFDYILTAIGPCYTPEVRDIIMYSLAVNAYQTLRTKLIKRISLSQEHKTRQLLENEEIGDRKLSQFLRYLRRLAGNVVGDGVLRIIWLTRVS